MVDWSEIEFFGPDTDPNLLCSHCGECHMDHDFMVKLDNSRRDYGKPIYINSGYRCPEYNAEVSNTGLDGPHTTGKAVDASIMGGDCWAFLEIAIRNGIAGIGVNQKGKYAGRFLHLDDVPDEPGRPRPWVWSY